ncbi:DUF3307 domain-containing protein [Sungkyunkwania multivorans]|uniref:DUF3307 domain-containing protein n=1 Tax=Sungkyunkwania multivorans TaxID=1173618 RepID=A0ABW3CX74_9FLAO
MELLLKLLLAHLVGDFVLQSKAWVKAKEKKKFGAYQLYLHVILHMVLTLLFLWDWSLWHIALVIAVSHLLIDGLKLSLQKKKNKRSWFFIDQALHIAVILGLTALNSGNPFIFFEPNWGMITALVFLSFPAAIILKTILSFYTPETEMDEDESLENAGKYIGMLERLLVFIFIASDHWEGVGFLIAAKSIFRFSDLTKAKDRKLTEYILIGTLLSFGFAIVTGITYQFFN